MGTLFGVVLTRSELISWFRMQEMFRFHSPRMYLIIGSAVLTAGASLELMRWRGVRTLEGEPIQVPPKAVGKGYRYWIGGSLFGVGWALTGACPGPLFALVGAGVLPMIVTVAAAILGTWAYGQLRPHLPH
jgi:hypothetical protein